MGRITLRSAPLMRPTWSCFARIRGGLHGFLRLRLGTIFSDCPHRSEPEVLEKLGNKACRGSSLFPILLWSIAASSTETVDPAAHPVAVPPAGWCCLSLPVTSQRPCGSSATAHIGFLVATQLADRLIGIRQLEIPQPDGLFDAAGGQPAALRVQRHGLYRTLVAAQLADGLVGIGRLQIPQPAVLSLTGGALPRP